MTKDEAGQVKEASCTDQGDPRFEASAVWKSGSRAPALQNRPQGRPRSALEDPVPLVARGHCRRADLAVR
jgi:hypothetical protein